MIYNIIINYALSRDLNTTRISVVDYHELEKTRVAGGLRHAFKSFSYESLIGVMLILK